MVSADNYASLVDDPSQHPAYIPFVVMVIIVGSMFLLSLLLGVTYDVFIEHTTDQVKGDAVLRAGKVHGAGTDDSHL